MLIEASFFSPHAKQERKAVSELERKLKLANFLLEIDYFSLQLETYDNKRVASKPLREKIKGASVISVHLTFPYEKPCL